MLKMLTGLIREMGFCTAALTYKYRSLLLKMCDFMIELAQSTRPKGLTKAPNTEQR